MRVKLIGVSGYARKSEPLQAARATRNVCPVNEGGRAGPCEPRRSSGDRPPAGAQLRVPGEMAPIWANAKNFRCCNLDSSVSVWRAKWERIGCGRNRDPEKIFYADH